MAPLSLGWKQQLLHSGEKLHEVQTIAVDLYFSLFISKSTVSLFVTDNLSWSQTFCRQLLRNNKFFSVVSAREIHYYLG